MHGSLSSQKYPFKSFKDIFPPSTPYGIFSLFIQILDNYSYLVLVIFKIMYKNCRTKTNFQETQFS